MRMTFLLALTLVSTLAHAGQSSPPTSQDSKPAQPTWQIEARWAPWLGCWRAEDDLTGTGLRLCIAPETVRGVKMLTLIDEDLRMTESVLPDNVPRPVSDKECLGTARSEWSRNSQRLFRFADVTCGAESQRKLSGVSFLLEGPILVDVQLADLSGNKSVRVRRFHRSGNQKLPDGNLAPRSADVRVSAFGAPWTVEDVIEASGKIPGDAVQAALTEAASGFVLNKRALVAMDSAGVPANVIDLMVALSYPKRFVVERASAPPMDDSGYVGTIGWWDPFLSPVIPFSMLGQDCFSSYYAYGPAYGCGRYYSAYGWGYPYPYYYSYYPYGYGYGYPGWINVDNGNGSNVSPPSENGSADGRVVNGRGYTQIRNREPVPSPGVAGSGDNGSSSGGNGNSGTSSTGSSGVSSGGYSGGGSSGGDSGRTAVPRPPGGGR